MSSLVQRIWPMVKGTAIYQRFKTSLLYDLNCRCGKFNYASDSAPSLILDEWVDAQSFAGILDCSTEKTIEVFWKTAMNDGR